MRVKDVVKYLIDMAEVQGMVEIKKQPTAADWRRHYAYLAIVALIILLVFA